ncbi:hypothetical protein AB0J14_38395 [Micromonospora arborensis]|uniref:hypothetical protein n=1 Tax=Micromonospora arborensis TaxID=2116518 RepID=UPI0033D4EC84
MPLLVSTTVVVDPPGGGGEDPRVITPAVDARVPRFTWIAPDGGEWPLDNPRLGWVTPRGRAGLGAAPVELVTDPHPRGGTRVRHVQPQSRVITWPLFIEGASHLEFIGRYRDLARAFTSTRWRGPGRLRVARPDGATREIEAFYQAGFDGEPGRGWLFDNVVLSLFCEDPYWRATSPVTLPYVNGDPVSYLDPYLTVSPSSVLGSTTATNPGDVEAWPSWTIVGPASEVTATNATTGQSFTLTPIGGALTDGQTVTITTDPPAVRGPAGEVWSGALNWPGAVLWGLVPGLNDVEFSVSGASAATSITLAYVPRYETA